MAAVALGVALAATPFHHNIIGYKGIGSSTRSCQAPIGLLWGRSEGDSNPCGSNAKARLVVSGGAIAVAILGVGVAVQRGRRHEYSLRRSHRSSPAGDHDRAGSGSR